MLPDWLEQTLREFPGPSIVCAQAGNVNSGAFDPIDQIAAIVRRHGGWLHVDGAFGLWAAASARHRYLARGLADADSWATDAHKWLNVPYDSGLVFVRDADAHRSAMSLNADYLQKTAGRERDGLDWGPEAWRRARAFVLWATLQTLGRRGVADLIDRNCDQAKLLADILSQVRGITIANDVVLNQVLVRLAPPRGLDRETFTRDVIARVQRSGICWLGGTKWQGQSLIRVSISNWMTTDADIEMSAQAIVDAYREAERAVA
jgi:glutamate/tyrosine decarboxylase-like PLP-dependent enzyme